MPFRPAASITENARYGLQAGSGARYSMRVDAALPDLVIGTRTRAERLLRAHDTYTGASNPGMSRLYELTVWFVMAVISRAWREQAGDERPWPIFDSLYGSPAS